MKTISNRIKARVDKSKEYRDYLLKNETYYERWLRTFLEGYKYEAQKVIFVDEYNFYIVDFYLPKYNVVIEVDGKQHSENKNYDSIRTRKLKEIGVRKVLRFKNEDFRTIPGQKISDIIKVNLLA